MKCCWRGTGAGLLGLLALAACSSPEAIAPPGGGGGSATMWRPGAAHPVGLEVESIRQEGLRRPTLHLSGVRIRLPLADGVLVLRARSGVAQPGSDSPLDLHGPVLVSGLLDGAPVSGTAVFLRLDENVVELGAGLLAWAGHIHRFQGLTLAEDWRTDGGQLSGLELRSAGAAVAASLASLPIIPPARTASPHP